MYGEYVPSVSGSVLITTKQKIYRRSFATLYSFAGQNFNVLEYYATLLTYSDHQTSMFRLQLRLG